MRQLRRRQWYPPRNARRLSQKQLNQIAASIQEFGFNSLVVVDEDWIILVGHGRVKGAPVAGLRSIPVLRVAHLTPEQKIAFALADNKIASTPIGKSIS